MAVTITAIGPNSKRVDYDPGSALVDVINAIETALTAMGWTLHDAAAGVNARAYSAVCVDGVRTKYIVLDFNTAGYMLCKTYESWNAATHAGTNLCYLSDNTSYAQRLSLTNGGQMFVLAAVRYACFLSYQSGLWGASTFACPCGCFEYLPSNPEDTAVAGYPCWVWLNMGQLLNGNSSLFSPPRNRAGQTGAGAAGPYNNVYNNAVIHALGVCSSMINYPSPGAVNPWNSNYAVSDLLLAMPYYAMLYGKLFGIKIYAVNVGTNMDTVPLKIDASGFYDPVGTLTNFWLLTNSSTTNRVLVPQ